MEMHVARKFNLWTTINRRHRLYAWLHVSCIRPMAAGLSPCLFARSPAVAVVAPSPLGGTPGGGLAPLLQGDKLLPLSPSLFSVFRASPFLPNDGGSSGADHH